MLLHWWGKTLPITLPHELCPMNYEVFYTGWWEQQAPPLGELRIIYSGPRLCLCPRPRQFSHKQKAHRRRPCSLPWIQGVRWPLPVPLPVPLRQPSGQPYSSSHFFPSTVFVAWHLKCRKLVFYLVKIVSKRSIIPVHVTPPWRESAIWPCSSAASEKLLRRVTSSPQSVMSLKSYCHNPFFSKWYVINAHLCSLDQTHATCSWSVIPSQIFKYFPTLENHVK